MRTPCTLETWKGDKCQKVKTRNGLTPLHMRDISYQGKTVFIYDIDDEVHICGTDGKVNPDSDSDFDLFIVKEKKVLSETEKGLMKEVLRIAKALGLKAKIRDNIHISSHMETLPVTVHGIEVMVEACRYCNTGTVNIEVTFTLPEGGALANTYMDFCNGKETIPKKSRNGRFGPTERTFAYSPWNNNFLVVRSWECEFDELSKAGDEVIELAGYFMRHLDEYPSLRFWTVDDEEVKAKAREVIANADFEETDCDREEKSHWLKDRNSCVKGWFYPFNDRGRGTFDTLWPSSIDYAASNMGIKGSFEYAVSCIVLENEEYISKARSACRIREFTKTERF